jgi:hypothetical protein
MLVDVQEMVDQTEKVKEGLGKDVEGFDDNNYKALQGVRGSYA